MAYFVLMCY